MNLENHKRCLLRNHRDNNKRKSDDLEEGIKIRPRALILGWGYSWIFSQYTPIHKFVAVLRYILAHLSKVSDWSIDIWGRWKL